MRYRIVEVPIKPLTPTNAAGIGHVFTNFAEHEIEIVQWPAAGARSLEAGTGVGGGVVEGAFDCYWRGEVLKSRNHAVGRDYVLGWTTDPEQAREEATVGTSARPFVLIDLINYHSDGGQAFISRNQRPTVYLVAPPGDAVTPEDCVAFYSDCSIGLEVNPGVWHHAPLQVDEADTYDNKQGRVHFCVTANFLEEREVLLSVPLRLN